jgi:transcriptional regulator with XRE-family HTH domain
MATTLSDEVRERLRALRAARGMSLEAVGARAGLAASTVARLESGDRALRLDHLPVLADALGVGVADLLPPGDPGDPRVREPRQEVGGMQAWPLTRAAPGGLQAFKLRIPVRDPLPEQRSHEGFEWLYVLAGRLRLALGDREWVLDPGEAAEFSTWTPHAVSAVGAPAEVLVLFGRQGERVHLRAGDGARPRKH